RHMNIKKAKQYIRHDSDSENTPIIDNNKYNLEDEEKANLTNNVNLSTNDEIEYQLDYKSENDFEGSKQWEQQLQEIVEKIQQLIDNANISKP
ncbi:23145_t:CDS:2, partial [Dentiscutata erythropus]